MPLPLPLKKSDKRKENNYNTKGGKAEEDHKEKTTIGHLSCGSYKTLIFRFPFSDFGIFKF